MNYITMHWRDRTEILNVDSERNHTESDITVRIFSGVQSEDSVGHVTVFRQSFPRLFGKDPLSKGVGS